MGLTVTVAKAVAGSPPAAQVIEYDVVTDGDTAAEPEIPEAVKPLPVQVVAFAEVHDSVDDCPGLIDLGLAESEAVTTGGGVVNEPAVHGVNDPPPQQVLNTSPFTGVDGFDVWPHWSSAMIPFVVRDRFGFVPLAATGS